MRKLLSALLFSVAGISAVIAQTPADSTQKRALQNRPEVLEKTFPKRKAIKPFHNQALKNRAASQITSLKNGVLLVRLRTSDIAIKNLQEKGNDKMAATLIRQQEAANKRLVYAFEKQFDFCPVFFFFSHDTDKLKAGKTRGFFLNRDLKVNPNLAIPDTNYFVAELTELEQFRIDPDSPQESVNAEVTFKALVVRDAKFHQLARPFPFFVKVATNFPPRKRSEAEMVDLLNARLTAFYKGRQNQ